MPALLAELHGRHDVLWSATPGCRASATRLPAGGGGRGRGGRRPPAGWPRRPRPRWSDLGPADRPVRARRLPAAPAPLAFCGPPARPHERHHRVPTRSSRAGRRPRYAGLAADGVDERRAVLGRGADQDPRGGESRGTLAELAGPPIAGRWRAWAQTTIVGAGQPRRRAGHSSLEAARAGHRLRLRNGRGRATRPACAATWPGPRPGGGITRGGNDDRARASAPRQWASCLPTSRPILCRTRLAVRQRPAPHRARLRLRPAVRHVRPVPAHGREPGADGQRHRRARHADPGPGGRRGRDRPRAGRPLQPGHRRGPGRPGHVL